MRIGLRVTTRRLTVGTAALLVSVAALAPGPATAQVDCVADPADPACVPDDTSTTVDGGGTDESTTTTEAEPVRTTTTTTTTARRPATTETPDEVDVGEEEEEVVDEPATTLPTRPALLVTGPPLVEPTPAAPEVAQDGRPDPGGERLDADTTSSSEDDPTRRTVTLAIAGLLTAAGLLGALTWWYWRRTRPDVIDPVPATRAAGPSATPAARPRANPAPTADDDNGSAPTGVSDALDAEDADRNDDHPRPPMASPPGRVGDRAR